MQNPNNIWEFSTDENGRETWRLVSPNNEEIGRGSQTFCDLSSCIKNAKKMSYRPRISKRRRV